MGGAQSRYRRTLGTTLSDLNSELKCPPLLPEGKDYHAYFLYRTLSSDRDWVTDVITRLEKDGLKCGFHERDFNPGQTVISNTTDALKKSQNVVLVISPDFHQSVWTKYETELATLFSIKQSPSRLSVIPVLFRHCEISDCLKNLTYLDAQMEERIWWPRLKKAIMCNFGGPLNPDQQKVGSTNDSDEKDPQETISVDCEVIFAKD